MAGKSVAAGPARDDRREGHPVDEEGAEHLARLRALAEQHTAHLGSALPQVSLQRLPVQRAARDRLAHLRQLRFQGDPTLLLGAERVEHSLG